MGLEEEYIADVEGLIANKTIPDYYYISAFELGRAREYLNLFIIHHQHFVYYLGAIYIFVTFLIQRIMKYRPAFQVNHSLFYWNLFLLIVNATATVRILPLLLHVLNKDSFFASLCTDRTFISDPVCGTWLILFLFIKVVELGDTIFLVLQKKQLDVYFWFHHFFALVGSWYLYPSYAAFSMWLCTLISASHIPIYLYGVVRSYDVKIPEFVKFILLLSELCTVFLGTLFTVCLLYFHLNGANCHIGLIDISLMVSLFTLCVLLCFIFLYKKVFKSPKKA